jgi:hypothetical protein
MGASENPKFPLVLTERGVSVTIYLRMAEDLASVQNEPGNQPDGDWVPPVLHLR